MRCKACNEKIPDNARYCQWCGAKQDKAKKEPGQIRVPAPKQLPSGNWRITLRAEGATKTFQTKEEAIAWATALRAGLIKNAPRNTLTLRDAYKRYVGAKNAVLSPSTIRGYESLMNNTFQSLMGQKVDSLTAEQIQREVNKLSKTHSPKYTRNAYALLTAVLSMFREDFSPNASLPQKQKPQQRNITPEEMRKIVEGVKGTKIEVPVLCGLWMGMRMSEIRGARTSDIKDGVLHIRQAKVRGPAGDVLKPPKTFSGDRYIKVPTYIQSLLPPGDAPLTELSSDGIYERFQIVCREQKIPPCRFHDLRHANAAVMVALGINSKTAQQRNGWSSEEMYRQVYAYGLQDQENAAALIDEFFNNL